MFWYIAGGLCCGLVAAIFFLSDHTPAFKLAGKRVIVTGGSSGIGLATAQLLVGEGCSVAIFGRDKVRLAEAEALLKSARQGKASVISVSVDVGDDVLVAKAVEEVVRQFGGVDVLVACAGYSRPGRFLEIPINEFEKMLRVNYLGSVYATRAVVPHMIKQGTGGRIVLTSSMGGLVGIYGFTAYSPSKFALRGFAECLHMEMKPHNILVSVVNPPDTETPGYHEENKVKPEECRLISEGAGLFSPQQIARDLVSGLKQYRFFINTGTDGAFSGALCSGMSPPGPWYQTLAQLCTGGLLRLVSLAYLWSFNRIVSQCFRAKKD